MLDTVQPVGQHKEDGNVGEMPHALEVVDTDIASIILPSGIVDTKVGVLVDNSLKVLLSFDQSVLVG